MRRLLFSLALFVVFSFQAGQISAASISTYAHVNLVPGVDAQMVMTPETNTSHFSLSGPSDLKVTIQVSANNIETRTFNSSHDTLGKLNLDLPLLDPGPNDFAPSDRIITVVYE